MSAQDTPSASERNERESVDEVLSIVETYGPWGTDINESLRFQIVLAEEVKALRKQRAAFSMDASNLQHELDVLRTRSQSVRIVGGDVFPANHPNPQAVRWAKTVLQHKDAATAHEIIAAEELVRLASDTKSSSGESEALRLCRKWIEEDEGRTLEKIVEIDDMSRTRTGRPGFNEQFVAMCRAVIAAGTVSASEESKDAARYRHLRDELIEWKPAYYDGGQKLCMGKQGRFDLLWPNNESNLDAAVDASMNSTDRTVRDA